MENRFSLIEGTDIPEAERLQIFISVFKMVGYVLRIMSVGAGGNDFTAERTVKS